MRLKNRNDVFMLTIIALYSPLLGRSAYRSPSALTPSIRVFSPDTTEVYTLSTYHLDEYSLFKLFDKNYLYQHLLPEGPVIHKNTLSSTEGKHLSQLIEKLLIEIHHKKKRYKHFTILQKRDFNRTKQCGLLVVKFNDHPFVLKLFIETPKSFTHPHYKGFIPLCLFYMGGGINRHLAGFTRIKNREIIKNTINASHEWRDKVILPRKWFWLPESGPWITIKGKNINGKTDLISKIPGIYGIVADEIRQEKNDVFSLFDKQKKKTALNLCNFCDLMIDPHINNFMIDKETKKLTIIDTEHFPTIVGLKEKRSFKNYCSWYFYLSCKCLHKMFFRTKLECLAQKISHEFQLL